MRNESDLLKLSVLGIEQCRGSRPEVIVVDDGSSPEFARRIAQVTAEFGRDLLVLDRHRGPSAARNRGFQASKGDVVIFLDADVVPHIDCLEKIQTAFEADANLAAIVGSYDDSPRDTGYVSQYRNLLHSYVHHSSGGRLETFWTGCGAVRREVFAAAGGFNEVYDIPSIEDVEFGVRLAASGQKIVLDPSIEVCHQKGWTLTSMLETDLLYRALPWTVLAWSGAGLPANLNFTLPRRFSVAITFVATFSLALSPVWHRFFLFAIVGLAIVGALNVPFLRCLYRRKGFVFSCVAFFLHWVHYVTSAVGFLVGSAAALRIWVRSKGRSTTVRGWN